MKKTFTFFLFLLLSGNIIFAQNGTITGYTKDVETKDVLAGATVKIEKTKGRLSDADGKFTLSVPPGEHELTISYIGYKTEKRQITVKENDKIQLEILMKPSALQLDQVVTVSQYGKNAAKETVSTDVIGKELIDHTASTNLNDIVSKSPGVLVQDGQISIRGGSSYSYGVGSRTAVLTDGMSLASSDLGQVQGNMVPVENVKQVEVIKGASSVVYGSSAMNGVVNVITQWPTDNEPKTEITTNAGVYGNPPQLSMKWWNTALPFFGSVFVNHQRRIKNVQLVCGGSINSTNSYLQNGNEWRARAFFKLRYISPKIQGLSFGANGEIQLERTDIFFISKNLTSGALVPADVSGNPYLRFNFDPWVTYSTVKGHTYKLNVRYMSMLRWDGVVTDAVSNSFEIDNQYQYRLKKDLFILTAGAPVYVAWSNSNLYPGVHDNFNVATYVQGEFNYKILSVQAGIRYEVAGVDTQIIKTKPIFRSGINLQVGKASWLRASWGQGYRVPSIGEKYIAQPFTSSIVIIPNDSLREETSWSFELGYVQGFKIKDWKLFLDVSFFWQQYKDYIQYQVGLYANHYPNGQQIFPDSMEYGYPNYNQYHQVLGPKPFNIENARVAGYEIDLKSMGKIGPVGISILAGYTYNYPANDTSAAYSTGNYIRDLFKYAFTKLPAADSVHILDYRMRHLLHADIELSYWKAYLGASFSYYSSPQFVPEFYQLVAKFIMNDGNALNTYLAQHSHGDFVMDIRAGVKVNQHFSMGFVVKNVANHFYELRPGLAEPIRNYTLQFKYSF